MPSNLPIFPQAIENIGLSIKDTNSSGIANGVVIRIGSESGDKIESLSAISTDVNPAYLTFFYETNPSGVVLPYRVGTVQVPAGAGTNAAVTPAVDILGSTSMLPWVRSDSNGRYYIYVANGWVFKCYVQTTLPSTRQIDLVGQLGVF